MRIYAKKLNRMLRIPIRCIWEYRRYLAWLSHQGGFPVQRGWVL